MKTPAMTSLSLRIIFLLTALITISDGRLQRESNTKFSRRRHSKHLSLDYPYRYSGGRYIEEEKLADYNYGEYGGGIIELTPSDIQEQSETDEPEEPLEEEPDLREESVLFQSVNSTPPNCPSVSCHFDFEFSKDLRIMQIKEQILKQTGIKKLPNMTGFILPENPYLESIICNVTDQVYSRNANDGLFDIGPNFRVEYAVNQSSFMRNLKCNQSSHPHHGTGADQTTKPNRSADFFADDPNIKHEKIFITATNGPESVRIPMGKLHYFNLSSEHSSSIEEAILHIYLKPIPDFVPKDKFAQIAFYKVEPPKFFQDYNRLRSVSNMNSKITVPYSMSGSWEKINVFSLVREWVSNQSMNLGFVINISVDGINLDIDTADEDPSHAPMLELDVKEEKYDRQKRHTGNRLCSEEKKEKECCRYPLIVDFMEYQYDFIVAPKKYKANYCQGECPFLYAHKVPHTTLLQQKFNDTSKFRHGPCCGASNLAPLTMVYYDGEKIKIETIDDMVVVECSCK